MVATHIERLRNIKKTPLLVALLLAFSFVTSMITVRNASAATLTYVMVRFDRMKISTFTSGTVCAKPTTAGTEASVKVTFPTGYTVSSTTSNWTVDTATTTGWPSGATAWLGINTASAASGQDVTFPSSDLTIATLYCFNWTNNSAALQTKSSATTSNSGTVTTQTSAPATIDSAEYQSATIADDQVAVTATIPQSFSFSLSGNSEAFGTLSTGSVATGSTNYARVDTNAQYGWQVWAKDDYQGLCAASVGTCTVGSATTQLSTTATASNRTLVAGTSDFVLGVTSSQTSGTGTITSTGAGYNFDGTAAGQGGGLSATTLQTLATSNGTANNARLTLKISAAIDAIEPASTGYTDKITVVGAGLF